MSDLLRSVQTPRVPHRYAVDEYIPLVTNQPQTPPPSFLRLPYELHEKIALCLDNASDTLSLANSCFQLRSILLGSNYIWYRLLNLAGSIETEYDIYHPQRKYYDRVVKIRQGKRLRCQICLGKDGVRTVDCSKKAKSGGKYNCYPTMGSRIYGRHVYGLGERIEEFKTVVFLGVFCGKCLEGKFYDVASFEAMQDKFWDGIINPPVVRLPRWLVCKALSAQYTQKRTFFSTYGARNGVFATDQNPVLAILRSDAQALMDATTDDEATDEVMKMIEIRNERLAEMRKRTKMQEKEFVLDYMVEAYEDFYESVHHDTPVKKFEEWWRREVFQLSNDVKQDGEYEYGRSSKDPVRQLLLRSYGRRSSDLEISRWADMLHDVGPGFKTVMKENMRPNAQICSFSWTLQF
ncbi:hypothetical protein TWF281_001363 [Arthrobotrys megalospora]